MSRVVPYTTKAGVKIGLYYEPPRKIEVSRDMERLQACLLETRGQPRVSRFGLLPRLRRLLDSRWG